MILILDLWQHQAIQLAKLRQYCCDEIEFTCRQCGMTVEEAERYRESAENPKSCIEEKASDR